MLEKPRQPRLIASHDPKPKQHLLWILVVLRTPDTQFAWSSNIGYQGTLWNPHVVEGHGHVMDLIN
jgi:hypothetical protein